MHIDLAHAVISAVLILLTFWGLRASGIAPRHEGKGLHWDWKVFFAVLVVMFIFNLIWPYS